MGMLNRKACLVLMALGFLIIASAGLLLALNDDYNRPAPLMDYVPQEMGMYDGRYDQLGEMDCRACHGDSLADRHHHTPRVLEQQTCGTEYGGCHEAVPEPPGFLMIRDCTTSGCHSWNDVLLGDNGWHHATDLSEPENCVICHDPNLVGPIGPFIPFAEYPPVVVTPTPFSCENCHWEQEVVHSGWTEGDPAPLEPDAGHPSTYDHDDPWGHFLGYYEYGLAILGNFDTHHMDFIQGSMASDCLKCHPPDGPPPWDMDDPESIRRCEICHNVASLHTIFPHVGGDPCGQDDHAAFGWEATGFHTEESGDIPVSYRSFVTGEHCFGCHGDNVPCYPGEPPHYKPAIRIKPRGIHPAVGQPGLVVELRGEYFGDAYGEYTSVEVQRRTGSTPWIDMPVSSWSDDRVLFNVPVNPWTLGNYWVRIRNEYGVSNQVVFTFTRG
ncbi:MAG: hypothetical protein SWH78_01860 [Thermodesulfobacteriota bacterium]|nr:hypothetical protein [Thermodesulfobacteriota bacterium]